MDKKISLEQLLADTATTAKTTMNAIGQVADPYSYASTDTPSVVVIDKTTGQGIAKIANITSSDNSIIPSLKTGVGTASTLDLTLGNIKNAII